MSMPALQQVLPRWPTLSRWAATPLVCALTATAFLVVATLAGSGPSVFDWLGDTDDATRLVSVRELLAGAPWFDTTLPRIGAPVPLVSHWSRLIDAPLAALIGGLSPLLGSDSAEIVTRILWPTLLFLALAIIVAREAQRRSGPLAAAFTLFLVVTSAMALAQFRPGRIDHHNAQILCAVAGLWFLARSVDDKRAGWIAGAFLGFGLAVGYEALALVVLALALAAIVAVWRPQHSAGVVRAAAAATCVLFLSLTLTVPPSRWFDIHCDALSLNLPLLAAYGTFGLWVACSAARHVIPRLAVLGLAAICGGAIFAGLEPKCLAGPFGQIDPVLAPIWLDFVVETQSIFWLAAVNPAMALALTAFLCAGVAAQVALWRKQRDVATSLAVAFTVLAAGLGFWQMKLLPYACWLVVLPIAVWAAGLGGFASLSSPVVRIAAVVLLSQATLETGFDVLVPALRKTTASDATAVDTGDPRRPCFFSDTVRRLAALPPGLIAANIDLGPYIVALSPHRVVAAPYHRLAVGIIDNQIILESTPWQGLAKARSLGVDYLAFCTDAPNASTDASGTGPLRERLLSGEPIAGTRELPMPAGSAIRVWRVLPAH